MRIGGFQRFSLSEFPGRMAAIVFTQGCNFRCPYCHNPELVDPDRFSPPWPEERVLEELAGRRGRLQGVAITGGEPTLQDDIESFAGRVRDLGFAVKLDTNGSRPDVLERLLAAGLLDHVGLDVKAPISRYAAVAGVPVEPALVDRSIALAIASGVEHEIRTTWAPSLLQREEMLRIADRVQGCRRWVIQRFVASKTLDPALMAGPAPAPTPEELESLRAEAEALGIPCVVR